MRKSRKVKRGQSSEPHDKTEPLMEFTVRIRGNRIEQWSILQPYGDTWAAYIKNGNVLKKIKTRLRMKSGDRVILMRRKK